MSQELNELRSIFVNDFKEFAQNCLKIRSEEGPIIPFVLNREQLYVHELLEKQKRETGKVRAIILKGRQQGISTYIEARFYHTVITNFGIRAFILTHDASATSNLYDMALRYHTLCPEWMKPVATRSNSRELYFESLSSGYKCGTAGNKGIGRSSTIQLFHGSETAYYSHADEHIKGIFNSVPSVPGTELIHESTSRGVDNLFHRLWTMAEAGQSDYMPIFIPWFWHKSYAKECGKDFILTPEEHELAALYKLTKEQLNWRRHKILEAGGEMNAGVEKFMMEFPCSPAEAFMTSGEGFLIMDKWVVKARKCESVESVGPLIIGVDPAYKGKDCTAIIRRRGRMAYGLERYQKLDAKDVSSKILSIVEAENPAFICVDVGGIGINIVENLKYAGLANKVKAINFGSSALHGEKYANKRAEMWQSIAFWLQETPCKIPDDDALHADLTSVKYGYRINSQLLLEPKENAKARIGRSPDSGDALALTFGVPEHELYKSANLKAFINENRYLSGANLNRGIF